eukprot:2103523-Rhodomonas_salina.1
MIDHVLGSSSAASIVFASRLRCRYCHSLCCYALSGRTAHAAARDQKNAAGDVSRGSETHRLSRAESDRWSVMGDRSVTGDQ